MIAKLTFPNGTTAALGNNLIWRSSDRTVAQMLNSRYSADAYQGPSVGEPGFLQAREAADSSVQGRRDNMVYSHNAGHMAILA